MDTLRTPERFTAAELGRAEIPWKEIRWEVQQAILDAWGAGLTACTR